MREVTKKYNVYTFEELDKEIQEKLIRKQMEDNLEFYCETTLFEDMQEKAKELLKKYFGDKAEFETVLYDLSYCQGRGSMIEFKLTYCGKHAEVKNYGYYTHENSYLIHELEYFTQGQLNRLKDKIYRMNRELTRFGDSIIENEEYFKEWALEDLQENEYLEDGTLF